MSEPLVQDDVVKELVNLKKEMIELCFTLTKDIGAMSHAFSNEVTVAIMMTRQHAETQTPSQSVQRMVFESRLLHNVWLIMIMWTICNDLLLLCNVLIYPEGNRFFDDVRVFPN